jgi:hypothetical protein
MSALLRKGIQKSKGVGEALRAKAISALGRGDTVAKDKAKDVLDEHDDHREASKQAYRSAAERELPGYDQDMDLSSAEVAVWVHKTEPRIILAFRGTVVSLKDLKSTLKDIRSDLAITTGLTDKNKRFKEAQAVYRRVEAKYPSHKIQVTGHSLGGSLAQTVVRKENVEGVVFNPGQGAGGLKKKVEEDCGGAEKKDYCDKLTTHKIEGDPVSAIAGLHGNVVTHKGEGGAFSRHTIDAFKNV